MDLQSRRLRPLRTLSVAAAIALLAGCSRGSFSAIAPTATSPQGGAHSQVGGVPAVLSLMGKLNGMSNLGSHPTSFYACPAKDPIKYVSDFSNSVVDVYVGKFAGQAPCAQITSGLLNPWGLYVKPGVHDLYVANSGAHNILVFHRGQISPYNTYTDPTVQQPVDVTTAKDGTVIASNFVQPGGAEAGSISTWIGGSNGGKFVGNFAMKNGGEGLFVTVLKNDRVYYNDYVNFSYGTLWSLRCPAGACGAQTEVAGVKFESPGGLAVDNTGDLVAIDTRYGSADVFELPWPKPKIIFLQAGNAEGVAFDGLGRHMLTAEPLNKNAAEYSYPDGVLIGTVQGNPGGVMIGVAVDPGHGL